MKRFPILPVLALGLHLICGLSALNCSELKWRENPVDVFEMIKTNFTLECRNDSASADEYRWTKDDNPVIESSTVKSQSSLQFLNFSESDEGLYKCLRLGSYCKNVDINPLLQTIRLRQPLFTTRAATVHSVQEYTYKRLACSDKGVIIGDAFYYNWYSGDLGIQIRQESKRMYTDLTGNLHITSVLSEDENVGGKAAKYYCEVSMPMLKVAYGGNDNYLTVQKVSVAPQSKPILQHKSENATAPLYKTAKLECVFSGYHATVSISYSWFLPNGSPVPNGDQKYQLSFNNRRLYILNVSESDGGVYHCQAENGVGVSTKEEVKLEVTCN